MMNWFDVLFRPDRIYADMREEHYHPTGALAVLLDGNLQRYLHLTQHTSWPSIENAISPNSGYELPAALVLQLTGSEAQNAYLRVLRDRRKSTSERALATAMLASVLANAADVKGASSVLLSAIESEDFTSIALAYLYLHLGVRQFESGDWQGAVESCTIARSVAKATRAPHSVRSDICNISLHNEFVFRQIGLGEIDLSLVKAVGDSHLWRVNELTAGGLEEDLESGFKARFTRSISTVIFGGGDSVESSLWGALLRAEALGDFSATERMRQNLGRYFLATAAGLTERAPDGGFALLLRGRDGEALGSAARGYIERGPISSVGRVANWVAASAWTPIFFEPSLKLLEEAADVLSPDVIGPLVMRLTGGFEVLASPTPRSRGESSVLATLAAVTRVAPPSIQAVAGGFALDLAVRIDDPFVLQALTQVIAAIDWTDQPAALVDRWVNSIGRLLLESPARRQLAESVFARLMVVRREELAALSQVTQRDPIDVVISALQSNSLGDLSDDDLAEASNALEVQLEQMRSSAAGGSYGFGRRYDPAVILAILLVERPGRFDGSKLLTFLIDPRVQWSDKATALRVLVDNREKLPRHVMATMRENFSASVSESVNSPFPDLPGDFEVTRLRLADALGVMSPSQLLDETLALASSSSPSRRAQAARAASLLGFASDSSGLTVVLLLSRDISPEVRAAACEALVSRRWSTEPVGDALVWPRVLELLSEVGREPTLGVLLGLRTGLSAGVEPPDSVKTRVSQIASRHLSWSVRTVGEQVLGLWA